MLDLVLKELEAQGIAKKSIALLFGPTYVNARMSSPFWDILFHLMAAEAQGRTQRSQEAFTIHFASPAEGAAPEAFNDSLSEALEAGNVDGILAVSVNNSCSDWLSARVPMVSFGCRSLEIVSIDESSVCRLAVSRLKQDGCRRIGAWLPSCLGTSEAHHSAQCSLGINARNHLTEALAEHGLTYEPAFSHFNMLDPELSALDLADQEQGICLPGRCSVIRRRRSRTVLSS